MKKISYLLLLLAAILVLPFGVFAEGEEGGEVATTGEEEKPQVVATVETDLKVNVYLFRGEGCPHCQEAEEWFNSIKAEYGSIFRLVDFEVWYDTNNNAIMEKVAAARGETVEGVPYILVGNKSWSGFTADYESEILSEIKNEYALAVADRHDMAASVEELANGHVAIDTDSKKEEEKSKDSLALILILVVTGAICFGVYKTRESSK